MLEVSYKKQAEHYNQFRLDEKKVNLSKTWLETDTVDAWRHQRMYKLLTPIIDADKDAKWLTIGDGRYGKDGNYIQQKGCDVLVTDIASNLLKEAKDIGYISKYKQENAESLSFQDDEFDYVFCKESYHHFRRPMIALYEMLRVARKGLILIEPRDPFFNERVSEVFFRCLKNIIKILFRRKEFRHTFEEEGNYVYFISRREIEKVAMGLNYRTVAFKGFNDAYLKGCEYEKLEEKGSLQKKIKSKINYYNTLNKLKLMDYLYLGAIIFKRKPSKELLQQLVNKGYRVVHLPKNPYQ
jgi:ubiquinone/menaquinone biosynthesis C-methylase UbiE